MNLRDVRRCFATALGLLVAGSLQAETLVLDFNDMQPGRLDVGQPDGAGQGFDFPQWTVKTSVLRAVAGDLVASEGLGYQIVQFGTPFCLQGVHASADRRQARAVKPIRGGRADIWFSFLVQNNEESDVTGIDFRNNTANSDPTVGPEMIFLMGQSLVTGGSGGGLVDVSDKAPLGKPTLIVGKMVAGNLSDPVQLSIWVNPALTTQSNLEAVEADFYQEDMGWRMTLIQTLGVYSYDSGPGGTGGMLDALRISNEFDAFFVVTGIK